jgi:hypothetical protein
MTREELRTAIAAAIKEATSIGGAPNKPCVIGHLSAADAALAALEAAGVRLVPSEPSREMLLKAGATPDGVSPRGGTDYLGKMLPKYYAAMLAASPYAPPEG